MSILDATETNGEQAQSSQLAPADTRTAEDVAPDGPGDDDDAKSTGNTDHQAFLKGNHVKMPFPWNLHEMLEKVEKDGNDHIVSWLPHGNGFRVHREKKFLETITPSYFNHSKFTSFTRQLYIYGFQKVQDGPDKGAFVHKHFVRSNKSLCLSMTRKKDKRLQRQQDVTRFPIFLLESQLVPIGGHCSPQHLIVGNPAPLFPDMLRSSSQSGTDQFSQAFLPDTSACMSSPKAPGPFASLQPSAHLVALSEIECSQLTGPWENQPPEEEDWLSKYERLTEQNILSIEIERTKVRHQNLGHSEVRDQATWMGQPGPVPLATNLPPSDIPLSWLHNWQTNMLAGSDLVLGQAGDEKIRPRFSNQCFDIEKRHDRRSIAELSKESDSFCDGDEADFEGMKFHFVDR